MIPTKKKEEKVMSWIALDNLQQLDFIVGKSTLKPQVIFKHSTRCGISRMVLKQFEADLLYFENYFDLYYLDLLNYRDVSNEIAIKFQIMHESPQLLIIKNGEVVAFNSHGAINDINLNRFI